MPEMSVTIHKTEVVGAVLYVGGTVVSEKNNIEVQDKYR